MTIAILDNNVRTDDGNDRLHRIFQIGASRYFPEYVAEVVGEDYIDTVEELPPNCTCYYRTIDDVSYVMWFSTTQKIIGIGEVI